MGNESLVFDAITAWRMPAVPQPLLRPLIHLIPRPVRRHFAFKLCEIKKDIPKQAPHWVLRIQALRHRDELDGMTVKQIHEHMEILDRPRKAVNLISENTIQLSGANIAEHFL